MKYSVAVDNAFQQQLHKIILHLVYANNNKHIWCNLLCILLCNVIIVHHIVKQKKIIKQDLKFTESKVKLKISLRFSIELRCFTNALFIISIRIHNFIKLKRTFRLVMLLWESEIYLSLHCFSFSPVFSKNF